MRTKRKEGIHMNNLFIGLRKVGEGKEGDLCAPVSFMEGVEKYIFVKEKGKTEGEYLIGVLNKKALSLTPYSEKEVWDIALCNTENETVVSQFPFTDMYFISNKALFRGAGGILSPKPLEILREKTGETKFIIIPSSINELILLPESPFLGREDELNRHIQEVNGDSRLVPEGNVLSDRLYKIDIDTFLKNESVA